MNLSDLSKFDVKDLKNIDWRKLVLTCASRVDLMVQIVGVVIAIAVSIWVLKMHKDGLAKSNADRAAAEDRFVAYDEYREVEAAYALLLKKLPSSLSEGELINRIVDLAQRYRIKLHSISPSAHEKKDKVSVIPVAIEFSAGDYASLWHFIDEIEASKEVIVIRKLDIAFTAKGGVVPNVVRGSRRTNVAPVSDGSMPLRVMMIVQGVTFHVD